MSLLKRVFGPRPNGIHEIESMKEAHARTNEKLEQAARRLSRAVENISREKRMQREESELAAYLKRARSAGAAE